MPVLHFLSHSVFFHIANEQTIYSEPSWNIVNTRRSAFALTSLLDTKYNVSEELVQRTGCFVPAYRVVGVDQPPCQTIKYKNNEDEVGDTKTSAQR